MEVNLIFKIAAVGILVSVISQILKQSGRDEHVFLVSPRRYPNGETRYGNTVSLHGKYIAMWRKPSELKHLSRRRKRKKHRFPK